MPMGRLCDADSEKIERGARMRKYRKKRGYTQEKLSGNTGVSREAISRCEGGHSDMKPDALIKLCVELRVSADVILGIVPDPENDEEKEEQTEVEDASDFFTRLSPENRDALIKFEAFLYSEQCRVQ